MNLEEKLKEAQANLKECKDALTELQELHKEQVKNQKALIYVAERNVKAYEKLIEKAKGLEKK